MVDIEQRLLWLSTAMIHHANRVRPNPSGLKVGGHQASSASMVSIMASLWFEQLRAGIGSRSNRTRRPCCTRSTFCWVISMRNTCPCCANSAGCSPTQPVQDPDPVDYSTGSVGIGATAPIWGAVARRYVNAALGDTGSGRQYSIVGDAELDEGAVWEAVLDTSVTELGEIVWIVDLNRQSLDRVVPNIAAGLERMFAAAGWQVITVVFGKLLEGDIYPPGRHRAARADLADANPEYQRLLRCDADALRARLPGTGPDADVIGGLVSGLDDATLLRAIRNLGGHDLDALREAYARIDDGRPTVIIAYTIKGYGLPTQGHPQNHSSVLTVEQFDQLAARLGMDAEHPWQRFDPNSLAGTAVRGDGNPVAPR